MDSLGYRLGDGFDMTRRVLGVSLSRPKNWKSENLRLRPASDVFESGPECRRLRGQEVRMPEAKRREKLRICRPGVANRDGVGARPEKFQVLEGWGGRIPGFQRADTQEFSVSGSNVPNGDISNYYLAGNYPFERFVSNKFTPYLIPTIKRANLFWVACFVHYLDFRTPNTNIVWRLP
jgi:hypothetical protein